jgi:hypothetical protein
MRHAGESPPSDPDSETDVEVHRRATEPLRGAFTDEQIDMFTRGVILRVSPPEGDRDSLAGIHALARTAVGDVVQRLLEAGDAVASACWCGPKDVEEARAKCEQAIAVARGYVGTGLHPITSDKPAR